MWWLIGFAWIGLICVILQPSQTLQATAPSFWGSLSDVYGRRWIYVGTLSTYIVACIALTFTSSFAALMILRIVQACGSAATISVGGGTIGGTLDV